jgi:hypothetical protein
MHLDRFDSAKHDQMMHDRIKRAERLQWRQSV